MKNINKISLIGNGSIGDCLAEKIKYLYKEIIVVNNENMKVFKFYCGETTYGFGAQTKELAIAEFVEQTGDIYTVCEEITQKDWDKKTIKMWEDNDFETEPFMVSINDVLLGSEPQMIFSNVNISNQAGI